MRSLVAAAGCMLVLAVAGPAGAGDAEAEEPVVGAPPVEPAEPPARAPERASGQAVWWNDPHIVETLELSEEQRRAMDAHLERFQATDLGARQPRRFVEALRKGEWDVARRELARLSEQATTTMRARGELKIDVLSVLTDAQREKLAESSPRVFDQPWGRAMRLKRGGGR